ncbi:phosphopantetheine-binding protein [Mycobacterium sp.]|uniref:phosphopantetheine-binding protein n=1 Tax=Mycobacterium sp. TaxID=1785 RepID=UPI003BABDB9F
MTTERTGTTGSDEVFAVVRSVVLQVLPDIDPSSVQHDAALSDLGANSVDRLDVSMGAMAALDLQIPMAEFAGISNLAGLVEVLRTHQGNC